jgi:hypothetical protein
MNRKRETALVTGAGSGIGREFAKLFYRDGSRVIAASLVREELDSLAEELSGGPGELVTVWKDLSTPDAAAELFRLMEKKGHEVDILVNNAGYGIMGGHLDQDFDRVQRMLLLNMVTLTGLTTLFAGKMRERGGGKILNVGSTTSFQPLPNLAAYAATKHYVVAFSEALARELAPHNISVTCLCPGTTDTAFLTGCGVERSARRWSVGGIAYAVAMSPADVAKAGYRGLRSGRRKVVPGLLNKLHFIGTRLLPNRVTDRIVSGFFHGRPVN